jgi:photosystem II stability/assembly factor-like uncharacterized protein
MFLKKEALAVAATMLLLAFGCQDDQDDLSLAVSFTEFGLEGKTVHELTLADDLLFAATDAGLFVRDLAGSGEWEASGLSGKNIKALVSLDDDTFLASEFNFGSPDNHLHKSTDGGQTWTELNDNFGGLDPEGITDLEYNSTSGELFASGTLVVAKSTDEGLTWTPIYGEWGGFSTGMDFVARQPNNGNLWASGQNAIEQMMLVKYDKSTEQWKEWTGLLRAPSVGKDIAFDPATAGSLIIGGEHGIIRSTNNGESWTKILEDPEEVTRFYFGVDYDQQIKDRIYAASWKKDKENPQPLMLHISENGGQRWQEFRHNDTDLFGGVYDMLQVKDGNKTLLYLGLFKGGVYLATVEN